MPMPDAPDLKNFRHSMQTTSTGSEASLGADDDDCVFSNHIDDDSHTVKDTRCKSKSRVPLADVEEFSEENGDVARPSGPRSTRSFSEGDGTSPKRQNSFIRGRNPGSRKRTRLKVDGSNSHGSAKSRSPVQDTTHIVDMNGNGLPKDHSFRLHSVNCYEDLERIFAGDNSSFDDEEDKDEAGAHPTDDEEQEEREDTDIKGASVFNDLIDFAGKYFNLHTSSAPYPSAISKTVNIVRRKSLTELVPVDDLLRYPKHHHLHTSLLHLLDPENVSLACSIFKLIYWEVYRLNLLIKTISANRKTSKTRDVCKYMRGELKADTSRSTLRSIIGYGLDRLELRDEIFCQLLRLTNGNPYPDYESRVWDMFCVCSVSFAPSKTLYKHLMTYLKHVCDSQDGVDSPLVSKAHFCLEHLPQCLRLPRKMPPSFDEIEAVTSMQPLVYKFHFLDRSTKTLALDPLDTAQTALLKLHQKIGLQTHDGWALYESIPDRDRFIHTDEYMTDILSNWERKQRGQGSHPGTPKKGSPKHHYPAAHLYGKLVMCKRLYPRIADIPNDPVELHLLYTQAVYHVVNLDEHRCPTHVCLHLAGLQAAVQFGDYDDSKLARRYNDMDQFLCERVLSSSDHRDWAQQIAAAHKRYGHNKTQREAKLKYLAVVSQSPLYACTKIFAHYRGVWPYGIETVLAVNYDGIKFISVQEKVIAFDFFYSEIEEIILEERYEECHIIIQLKDCVSQSRQKCYMFECLDLEDYALLIEGYCPRLAQWTQHTHNWRRKKFQPPSDWLKLYEDILCCRRKLLESQVVRRQSQEGLGLFRSALNKLSGRNCSSSTSSSGGHEDPGEELSEGSIWSFTKTPFKTSLSTFTSPELTDVAARMFNSTLVYTGLESAAVLEDMDLVVVMQTLITKCMENKDLCNEFYLQLIKQTTDTKSMNPKTTPLAVETNAKAVMRYWHLMTVATCVMLPPDPIVATYLNLHLRRMASQADSDEAKYAMFCIKSLYRTFEKKKSRRFPPSYKEIGFVTQHQPIEARVFLPDGHNMLIEFDSAATTEELLQSVKAKSGMRLDAGGFGIFELLNDKEHYLAPEDNLADQLFTYERLSKPTPSSPNNSVKDYTLLFKVWDIKKRVFVDRYANLNDPVEVDMLYHQSVTDVFEQKILLTKRDAIELCALRAQTEHGDHDETDSHFDYTSVIRILPRHLRDQVQSAEVAKVHASLKGLDIMSANVAFIDILRHWPLYGATMYDVTQTTADGLPKLLWLTVTQMGVHLMERHHLESILFTYSFDEIVECNPTQKNLSIVIGKQSLGPTYVFLTQESNQIAQLINDYREILAQRTTRPKSTSSSSSSEASDCPVPRRYHRQRGKGGGSSSSVSPKASPKRSPGLVARSSRDRSSTSVTPVARRRALFRERRSTASSASSQKSRTQLPQFCSLLHGDSLEDMSDVFLGIRGTKGVFGVEQHP
ncbi:hypothetical protein CAPTEDRAFT_210514 [Capitella teleta]|uniref:MyTH4 domain-containing protein n=1 Tax=Capitella teleta TaxID=283909 RepID=R7VEH1_CAPTE|nr:hypothetical protein CAPTEDRAFT_210514 [Capitella teleta]|eukprot:ELU17223.1 hypothetical protein CAPTEDRAFT_210514 [Capitella teleta]